MLVQGSIVCVCGQYLVVGLGFFVSVADPTSPSPLLLESPECCVWGKEESETNDYIIREVSLP